MNLINFISKQSLRGLFLILLFPVCLSAQQKTKIILQSSERSRIITKTDITYLRKPVFRQDNAILTCDSAVFYTAKNYFEAYDNVHINQADTINIYSDRLTYDGNAKLAHLTSNVRLVDKSSVLTTNVLDYSMVPKVGTYVDGGKIVNRDATITSKNGYYFANSRDAYFRYNVLVVTEQSTIKSDTLRYNTFSNWAYFYGPTNIKEKDGNLYTENGAYNTKTRYAYFGKNNLYTSGSRSMKGDSLYYDGIAGYGRAVRNIIFKDTADKMLMRGQLGYYYKADQRTVVTKNAYVGMGTEDSIEVKGVKQPDSLWMGADTLETQMVLQKTLKLIKGPVIKKDNELGEEERESKNGATAKKSNVTPKTGKPDDKKVAAAGPPPVLNDSLKLKVDSLKKGNPPPPGTDSVLKAVVSRKVDSLQKKGSGTASLKLPPGMQRAAPKDSLPLSPLDTARTRSIKAYRQVRVYKSNMQAKADSLFYTSADSTLRWYRDPIIWAENSQQTGDTIYLQLRNKKVSSVQVLQNAFSVNVDPIDTTKFNQIKGKVITGFFKDGKLNTMYVDGNAESVYFTKSDDGKMYDKMNQTISSRIKILFKNSEIGDVVPIKNVEGAATPVADIKQEVILTGFIWKPELRPRSKKDITNPKSSAVKKKPVPAKKTASLPKIPSGTAVKQAEAAAQSEIRKQSGAIGQSDIIKQSIGKAAGAVSKVVTAADSLKLKDKVPLKVQDSVKGVKQLVPLKKQ